MNNLFKMLQRVYRMIEKKVAVLGMSMVALAVSILAIQTLYYAPMLHGLNNQVTTQQDQLDSKEIQISSLNSQITNLQNQITDLEDELDTLQSNANSDDIQIQSLQNQLTSLHEQLLNATDLILQLQGPTGILPTYMDLGYIGPDLNSGNYFLQLSLKNTGTVPITQIYVTLNSVEIGMTFTYLNNTVNAASPLPSYETAIGIQDATPPVFSRDTFPLVIQAIAANGTIYTYQTTITSHV
jgi:cell division protein FtsB